MGTIPVCKHSHRGVGQSKFQVTVSPREISRHAKFLASQRFNHESSIRQVVQEGQFYVDPETGQDQVVRLCYSNPGGDQKLSFLTE